MSALTGCVVLLGNLSREISRGIKLIPFEDAVFVSTNGNIVQCANDGILSHLLHQRSGLS
jgi:hypothetical protein